MATTSPFWCTACDGFGEREVSRDVRASEATGGSSEATGTEVCEHCQGTGIEPTHEAEPVSQETT